MKWRTTHFGGGLACAWCQVMLKSNPSSPMPPTKLRRGPSCHREDFQGPQFKKGWEQREWVTSSYSLQSVLCCCGYNGKKTAKRRTMRAEARTSYDSVTSNMDIFSLNCWKRYQIPFAPVSIDQCVVDSAGSANWVPQGCLWTALLSSIISAFQWCLYSIYNEKNTFSKLNTVKQFVTQRTCVFTDDFL